MQNNVPLEPAKKPLTEANSPDPAAAPKIDLNDHRWYLNRELDAVFAIYAGDTTSAGEMQSDSSYVRR